MVYRLSKSTYFVQEYALRFGIWLDTVRYITKFNLNKKSLYLLGLTPFADYTSEEYRRYSTCAEALTALSSLGSVKLGPIEAIPKSQPTTLDWRTQGVVNPVRNQGQCCSSWAFGTVSTIESAHALVPPHSAALDLSEQELVDCSPSQQNDGCLGNFPGYAYKTVVTRGLGLESNYPYVSGDTRAAGQCRNPALTFNQPYVKIDGFAYGNQETGINENTLLAWAGTQPVGVLVDANERSFASYQGGIYDGPCGTDLNHMVTIVGYGIENNVSYWIIRNSWGRNWGEEGYMRIRRSVGGSGSGVCGINSVLAFPLYCGWNAECKNMNEAMKRSMAVKAVLPVEVQAQDGPDTERRSSSSVLTSEDLISFSDDVSSMKERKTKEYFGNK